jgi:cell division protein ZapA (FtsZ GTPase activity inhibitor)
MAHANRKQFTIYLTDEQNEKITKYAKKMDVSKQRLMSNLIDIGLDEVATLNKLGFLAIGITVRDLLDKIKKIDPKTMDNYSDES